LSVVIVVLTITYFSLVVGELVPKRLALGQPERYAAALAPLMRRLSWLTGPLVTVLTASTSLVTRGLGVTDQDKPEITEDEVRMMIAQGTQVGVFEPLEEEIVDQLFRLGDRMVNSILTPRPDVVALDSQQTPEAIKKQVIAAHHARFPVYTGELDRIIGIVSAADLLAQLVDNQPLDLQAIMTPPLFVPESLPALDLVEKMRRHRTQLAVVIDEYGGVEGLVTTSDILEALVGDLPEPGQETDAEAVQREDGSWLLDGRFPIDQLLDLFPDVERPDDLPYYYQTIGGFVMNEVGGVPQVGERFDWRGLRFEVVDMDDRRVDRVLVSQSPT
jgi:putative hemolysin